MLIPNKIPGLTNTTIHHCGKKSTIFIMPLYREVEITCPTCEKNTIIKLPQHIPPIQYTAYIEKKYHEKSSTIK